MDIKLIEEKITYYEKAGYKLVEINGKKVKCKYYRKQDNELNDYDNDDGFEVIEGEPLTDEESEEITEWVEENR